MALMRLDDGESGQLVTVLTVQNLAYQGAPSEAASAPDYNSFIFPNVVHTIGNTDSLSQAIATLGYAFTNRYGDSIFGALTWQAGSSIVVANGATVTFQNGVQPAFQNAGAPFTVSNSTVVANLNAQFVGGGQNTGHGGGINADRLDGYHASATAIANTLIATNAAGFLVTPSAAPTTDYEVANKKYVDDSSVDLTHYTRDDQAETIVGGWTFNSNISIVAGAFPAGSIDRAASTSGDMITSFEGHSIFRGGPTTYRTVYNRTGIYVPPATETIDPISLGVCHSFKMHIMAVSFRVVEDGGGARDVIILNIPGASAGQWAFLIEISGFLDDTYYGNQLFCNTAKDGIDTPVPTVNDGAGVIFVRAGGADVLLTNVASSGVVNPFAFYFSGDNIVCRYDMFADDRLEWAYCWLKLVRVFA